MRVAPGAHARGIGCDISSISALRSLATGIASEASRLDVLVNNAGVMPGNASARPTVAN